MAQLLDTINVDILHYTHTQSKQECSLFSLIPIPYANFPSIEYCFQTFRLSRCRQSSPRSCHRRPPPSS